MIYAIVAFLSILSLLTMFIVGMGLEIDNGKVSWGHVLFITIGILAQVFSIYLATTL